MAPTILNRCTGSSISSKVEKAWDKFSHVDLILLIHILNNSMVLFLIALNYVIMKLLGGSFNLMLTKILVSSNHIGHSST